MTLPLPTTARPESASGPLPGTTAGRPARGSRLGRGAALGAALGLLAASLLAGLAWGSQTIPFGDVVAALTGHDGSEAAAIVREMRWPRTVVAVVVGAALGLAGAQLQSVTRNPLAEPGLLGVAAGAALGVVLVATLSTGSAGVTRAAAAVVGAALATVLVLVLAGGAGRGPLPLVLAGVAVTAMISAVTSVLVLLDAATLDEYRFWVVGSVAGRALTDLVPVLPLLVLGGLLAVTGTRTLDLLALGDELAAGLGARVASGRLAVLVSATLLTAGAVAVAGPLVFVGLVVPHVARALVGPSHRWLLPTSAVLGACLLVLADVVGRVVARPAELQVGIVTAVIGAPVLIVLVQRRRLVRS